MKTINKDDRLRFNKTIAEILEPFPLDHRRSRSAGEWLDNNGKPCAARPVHRAMTAHGRWTITPDTLEYRDRIPTVFTRFETSGTPYGGYSGKWNIHKWGVDAAIAELLDYMNKVNARPPTDEELAEWEADDAAERKHYHDQINQFA